MLVDCNNGVPSLESIVVEAQISRPQSRRESRYLQSDRTRAERITLLFWMGGIAWITLATILVKNLPDSLLRELKRLKVELGCRTWAELLAKLVESERTISFGEEKLNEIRTGVQGFMKLRSVVSDRWTGHPDVLEETRRSRAHHTA
jgi:hypothetical protein